jgi:dihydroorotate dehydrogenase electron transfer subunit
MKIHNIVKIKKIVKENSTTKTFFLEGSIDYKPGQFIMLWIPGIDEKPFSLSSVNPAAVTVEKKGRFTQKLFSMKVGDKLGIRGPYGNGFEIKENAIVVAGGCGYAPLAPLIEKLTKPAIIFGCRTKRMLLFRERFKKLRPMLCTDDGSLGFKGFTSDLLRNVLKKRKFSIVYTCGPEVMMKKVFDICEEKKIECQASLERFMFCGMGICGSCACDGKLVCKDGPVFSSAQLRAMDDFGRCAKLKSGKKVCLKEFYEWRT